MNRPFWSFRTPQSPCDALLPLLPLYADGIASPAEARLVEAHLPGCDDCRAELTWMQATHAALASRPVAVPPPDLHSRIAQAIAASAPAPVTLRPARAFSLRPAYAAAASLTALGIALTYPLWHAPREAAVKHPAQSQVAVSVPVVKTHALPKTAKHTLVASRTVRPLAVKHIPSVHKTAPVAAMPQEQVAANRVPETKPLPAPLLVKIPAHRPLPSKQLASAHVPSPVTRTLVHSEKIVTPKQDETPKIAKVFKEPAPVQVHIQPPAIIVQPPLVQTASDDPLSGLKAQIKENNAQMRNASYVATQYTKRLSYSGAADLMRSMDDGSRTAYIDGIHSPR